MLPREARPAVGPMDLLLLADLVEDDLHEESHDDAVDGGQENGDEGDSNADDPGHEAADISAGQGIQIGVAVVVLGEEVSEHDADDGRHGTGEEVDVAAEQVVETNAAEDGADKTEHEGQLVAGNLDDGAEAHGAGVDAALSGGPDVEDHDDERRGQKTLQRENAHDVGIAVNNGADGAEEHHEGVTDHDRDDHNNDGGLCVLGKAHDVGREHNGADNVGADAQSNGLREGDGVFRHRRRRR